MTAAQWNDVERELHSALQLAPEERAAFVVNIGDADVRAEVSSLLGADASAAGPSIGQVIHEAARAAADDSIAGRTFGHFQVSGEIGRGGMGEVYLARDLTLGRQVALKLLPRGFEHDSERLRRFELEARAAAALNHANIMAVYEVGAWEGRPFIAAEYIEGETLSERLRRAAPSPAEAIRWAVQIADALAAAHEQGIVHRDLKPGNIKIRPDGAVKVLDFGLAKVAQELAPTEDSTTVTEHATQAGTIIGTPAYMSPEQARGLPVDKRTDIWAFGVVLYEMLARKSAFQRKTMTDTLAAVINEEPDFTLLPAGLRVVTERCLKKDVRRRWQDIGDVRIALEEGLGPADDRPEERARPISRAPWIFAALASIAALFAFIAFLRSPITPPARSLIRFNVDLGPQVRLANGRGRHLIAISPDGTRIAFACEAADGGVRICTRRLDQTQPAALVGTEGVETMFFSPDGKWIGFSANRKLKKVSVEGGAPFTLCDAPFQRGAAWGENGFIVAAIDPYEGLMRIPEDGGTPRPLTHLRAGEHTHRWPQVLPGAEAVLFTAHSQAGDYDNAGIDVVSIKTGERKTLHRGGYFGRYLPGGELLYMHQGTLFAARMDLDRLAVTGPPVPILEDVGSRPRDGGADFDFSRTGTFLYLPSGSTAQNTVQWLGRSGKLEPLLPTRGGYDGLRISPDGKRLALVVAQGGDIDIWVYDLERRTMSRVTFGGTNEAPVWSPDGRHLAYNSGRADTILWARADGSGDAQPLAGSASLKSPDSFSPDGKILAFEAVNPSADVDIWTVPLQEPGTDHPNSGMAKPFLSTPASEGSVAFSPDGRWLAYASDESGASQIYVRPFPGRGGKFQISSEGGATPMWSPNGRELFYISSERRIMVTSYLVKGASFMAGKPAPWSDFQSITQRSKPGLGSSNIDLAPDGKRFAVIVPANTEPRAAKTEVNVLLNFSDELRRRTAQSQ